MFNWIIWVFFSVFWTTLFIVLTNKAIAERTHFDIEFYLVVIFAFFLCFRMGIYGLICHIQSYLLDKNTDIQLDRQTGLTSYRYKQRKAIHFHVNDIERCTTYAPSKGPHGYYEMELKSGQKVYLSEYTDIKPILRMNPEIEQDSWHGLFISYKRVRRANEG